MQRTIRTNQSCKPNSVFRQLPEGNYLSIPNVTNWVKRSTRRLSERTTPLPNNIRKQSPYLTLLRVWFTVPPMLPPERWALTPPFHLYPDKSGKYIFCGTGSNHKISLTNPGSYPAPCSVKFGLSSTRLNSAAITRTGLFHYSSKIKIAHKL